jgi:hypothetical protein
MSWSDEYAVRAAVIAMKLGSALPDNPMCFGPLPSCPLGHFRPCVCLLALIQYSRTPAGRQFGRPRFANRPSSEAGGSRSPGRLGLEVHGDDLHLLVIAAGFHGGVPDLLPEVPTARRQPAEVVDVRLRRHDSG